MPFFGYFIVYRDFCLRYGTPMSVHFRHFHLCRHVQSRSSAFFWKNLVRNFSSIRFGKGFILPVKHLN
ncbi:hypothetical protein BCO37747_03047 [Burkholderia contaminans]|jgi:hypothetical protein|nr:hypothetical protein BCO37747_03047 [Burkholderia contaminans]